MTDYLPLLSRAVTGLASNTPEARRVVYDRARQALVNQLRAMTPPLAESEITRERLALEEAIRRLELQCAKTDASGGQAKPEPSSATTAPSAPPRPSSPPASGARGAGDAVSGTRVVRAAAAEAQPSGAAPAEPARSPREAKEGAAPTAFDVETQGKAATASGAGAAKTAGGSPEGVQPRSPRERSLDLARADARKALKAKLTVGGLVVALLAVAVLIGYVHRDRILALIGSGPAPTRTVATVPDDAPKIPDRIVPSREVEARAPPSPQPPTTTAPAVAIAQRAVLYEENPGAVGQQLQTFVGTAVWRTETVSPGPGRPPELGLRVEVEIPDRKMTVAISIRRNPDETLPASHTIEVQFTTPGDPFGGVANMPGIRAKTTETAQGAPLVGLVVRVMPGYFLMGLSAIESDREQNLSLLRERGWLDVPFVYNNGRRAVLVIEKGTPGERAVNEAVMAWGG